MISRGLRAIAMLGLGALAIGQIDLAFAMPRGRDVGKQHPNHPRKKQSQSSKRHKKKSSLQESESNRESLTTAFSLPPEHLWPQIFTYFDPVTRQAMKGVSKELYDAMWDGIETVTFLKETIPQGLTTSKVFDLLAGVKRAESRHKGQLHHPSSIHLDVKKKVLFLENKHMLSSFSEKLSGLDTLNISTLFSFDEPIDPFPTLPPNLKTLEYMCYQEGLLLHVIENLPVHLEALDLCGAHPHPEELQALIQRLPTLTLKTLDMDLNPQIKENFFNLI